MSWTCQCSAVNDDSARFCNRCGLQFGATPALPPDVAPMQPGAVPGARPSGGIGFKLIVVGGVVLLGGIFGTLVAEGVFGGGTTATAQTAPTSRSSNTPSTYQDAFDASFKKSCRQ